MLHREDVRPSAPAAAPAKGAVPTTPCPWRGPCADGELRPAARPCGAPVRGIDPQRTCTDCRENGAPILVPWSYLTGTVPSDGLRLGEVHAAEAPREAIGSQAGTSVAEARARLGALLSDGETESA